MQKYLTISILLILFSCSPAREEDRVPDNIMGQEKMVNILTELHIAEAMARATPHLGDTNKQTVINYYNYIFKKNATTDSLFKISFAYYTKHPVLLDSVYSEVINRLSEKEVRFRGK